MYLLGLGIQMSNSAILRSLRRWAGFTLIVLLTVGCSAPDCTKTKQLDSTDARHCIEKAGYSITEGSFIQAVEDGKKNVVHMFITAGISEEALDDALLEAVPYESKEIISLIVKQNSVSYRDGGYIMQEALQRERNDILSVLLENGLSPSAGRKSGYPPYDPFIMALDDGNVQAAHLLLDHNISLETRDHIKYDPATRAACSGDFILFERVLTETDANTEHLRRVYISLTENSAWTSRRRNLVSDAFGSKCLSNLLKDEVTAHF